MKWNECNTREIAPDIWAKWCKVYKKYYSDFTLKSPHFDKAVEKLKNWPISKRAKFRFWGYHPNNIHMYLSSTEVKLSEKKV